MSGLVAPEEVADAPLAVRKYIGQQAGAFLESQDAEDLLAAHLNTAQDPSSTIAAVRTVLRRIALLQSERPDVS